MSYLKTEINKELNALVKQQHIRFWNPSLNGTVLMKEKKVKKIIKIGLMYFNLVFLFILPSSFKFYQRIKDYMSFIPNVIS